MARLTGRTVLITGATDGLGYALAHRLAEDGAALVLHGRRPDALKQTAGDVGRHGVEVSTALADQQPIDFDDVMLTHGYDGTRAYRQSKLALITLGFVLAERVPAHEVTINSLHPGTYMPTKMVLESVGHSIDSLETGVDATAQLVGDPSLSDTTGAYFNITEPARANAQAYDNTARQRLIELTENLIGQPIL